MNYIKVSLQIFAILAISRFVPHPPNFTAILALSFYIPFILGINFLPVILIAFVLTDLILGLHNLTLFTWASIIIIGFLPKIFRENIQRRIFGSLLGTFLFFIITNFGVWSIGTYGYSINGLISCYILALPFFGHSIISTLIFSFVIELILKLNQKKLSFKI